MQPMAALNPGRKPVYFSLRGVQADKCLLKLKNKSGVKAFVVLHDVENDTVKEMSFKRSRQLRLFKGTYVIEAWLNEGNIGINPENIQHVEIEDIPSKHNTSFRGKRIVADLVNNRDHMVLFEEITVADIIQRGI